MKSNLGHVIKFEIVRNLKKPTFWLAAFILPVLLVGYIALAGFTGYNASSSIESGATNTSDLKLGLYDASGYLTSNVITDPDGNEQELQLFESEEQGVNAVKSDEINVFYYIPADFGETFKVNIFGKSDNTSIFTSYETPIRTLLATSATANVDPTDLAVISGAVTADTINFTATNEEFDLMSQISKMIVPGVGLILFYVLVCLFGNRLTTAMVEEKENRISEMILTSLNPKDLITGKIISLIILGLIQLAALLIPILIIAAFGFNSGIIPSDFPIDLNPWSIVSTLILVTASYFLFTSFCVTIGTLVPTAKDAANFAAPLMILMILPMFFINSFMTTDSSSGITYFLSYFPPSAPIALMFRNTFGTLPVWEFFLGLAVLALVSFLVIKLAVYIYTRNAIQFTSRVNLRKLFSNPRKDWK